MGYLLVAITIGLFLGFILLLLVHSRGIKIKMDSGSEYVDIIEGASILDQQRTGRELNRKVKVIIPSRPLSFDEQINLRTIQEGDNQNVSAQKR